MSSANLDSFSSVAGTYPQNADLESLRHQDNLESSVQVSETGSHGSPALGKDMRTKDSKND